MGENKLRKAQEILNERRARNGGGAEKRRSKRLDLNVSVQLERLDSDGITTLKFIKVNVTDLSKLGIGFDCPIKLETGTFYNMKLQIWTKEVIDAVIEIVRYTGEDDNYHYGASFIGMTESDALKIEIYQIFNELEQEREETLDVLEELTSAGADDILDKINEIEVKTKMN